MRKIEIVVPQGEYEMSNSELYSDANLFIRHLSRVVDEHELRSFFAPYGEILSAAVMRNIHTGENLGTAFVRYANGGQATAALRACHGRLLHGRAISVHWARRQHDDAPVGEARHRICKLFVRNIPLDVTAGALAGLFAGFGPVGSVTLHRDTASLGEARLERRIAFVAFLSAGVAARAAEAVHNTCPFPSCHRIPVMVKLAEEHPARHRRHAAAVVDSFKQSQVLRGVKSEGSYNSEPVMQYPSPVQSYGINGDMQSSPGAMQMPPFSDMFHPQSIHGMQNTPYYGQCGGVHSHLSGSSSAPLFHSTANEFLPHHESQQQKMLYPRPASWNNMSSQQQQKHSVCSQIVTPIGPIDSRVNILSCRMYTPQPALNETPCSSFSTGELDENSSLQIIRPSVTPVLPWGTSEKSTLLSPSQSQLKKQKQYVMQTTPLGSYDSSISFQGNYQNEEISAGETATTPISTDSGDSNSSSSSSSNQKRSTEYTHNPYKIQLRTQIMGSLATVPVA